MGHAWSDAAQLWPLRSWLYAEDQCPAKAELRDRIIRCKLDTQARPHDLPMPDQLRNDAVHLVHRDGESDTGKRTRWADDLRVDADQTACAVEQGTAGVARIDRCVRLDDVLDRPTGE